MNAVYPAGSAGTAGARYRVPPTDGYRADDDKPTDRKRDQR